MYAIMPKVNGEMRSTDAGEFEALLKKYADAVPVIEKEYGVKIDYSSDVLYKAFCLNESSRPAALTAKALQKCGVELNLKRAAAVWTLTTLTLTALKP